MYRRIYSMEALIINYFGKNLSNSADVQKSIYAIVLLSKGRLKSPAIDRYAWSKSIAGDFNRPFDATTM